MDFAASPEHAAFRSAFRRNIIGERALGLPKG
jgi:hypothetical protein